jgi:hypothetical protein
MPQRFKLKNIYRQSKVWLTVLATISACHSVSLAQEPVLKPNNWLIRDVPLTVSSYTEILASFPEKPSTASEIVQALNNTPNLLIHMELLRRGYHELPESEQSRLVERLEIRHQENDRDMIMAFDYGYAQLVYLGNKGGLYFLRKANDTFETQFTSLAYGMAQVDVDLNLEQSKPGEMTTRKMDAVYKLGDAVKLDSARHQAGFWPSFVGVIERIKTVDAYKSFSNRDFSVAYVPYGSIAMSYTGATSGGGGTTGTMASPLIVSNLLAQSAQAEAMRSLPEEMREASNHPVASGNDNNPLPGQSMLIHPERITSCEVNPLQTTTGSDATGRVMAARAITQPVNQESMPEFKQETGGGSAVQPVDAPSSLPATVKASPAENPLPVEKPLMERTFTVATVKTTLAFFPAEIDHQYDVQVSTEGKSPFRFKTYVMPSILEDLDRDGQFEIVARQYRYAPLTPVLVYRYSPSCGFIQDEAVLRQFE